MYYFPDICLKKTEATKGGHDRKAAQNQYPKSKMCSAVMRFQSQKKEEKNRWSGVIVFNCYFDPS